VQYTVDPVTHRLDYDAIRKLALEHRPRLLIAGATAYPRVIDFETLGSIAREAGAFFLADMAHIAGLVAGGVHPSPVPHADVVSTTTHKTLRGPRGGMLLCKSAHAPAIDKAVFPGLQCGPHNHTTAGMAVALHEAALPAFKVYAAAVVQNAAALAEALSEHGFKLVSGGTDNHLILMDVTVFGPEVAGKKVAKALDRAGIVCNYNTVPFDPRKPFNPSGVRLGTPAVTSRGMGLGEMRRIARWFRRVVDNLDNEAALDAVAGEVAEFCKAFPPPGLEHLV
jgi:glycine hydroxymethyltransferase